MEPTATSHDFSTPASQTFHWADYVIWVIVLIMSGSTGIFYGIKQRKNYTVDDFLVAGRSMPIIPVSLSIFVSWLSAISVLGDPVEAYTFGSIYWIIGIGYVLSVPIVALFFAPVYHRMKIISVNEFLRHKFGYGLAGVVTALNSLSYLVYLGVALYAPSLALSQMTGINVNLCVLINGGVCLFYTSTGGMKAVLWADTLQTGIMFAGILAALIEASRIVGGIGRVFEIAEKGGRINFNKFNPHPFARATFWTYLIGGFFRVLNPYISAQAWVQRYFTLKSERDLKIALFLNIPMYAIFSSLFALTGLVMFAYFDGCDPFLAGKVEETGQMFPLMVMETLGKYPGVPGLFLATICSAALSTLSSGQSALAAVGLRDVVIPIHRKLTGHDLSDTSSTLCAVALSIIFGVLNIGLAFLIIQLKETSVFALSSIITGSIASPLSGVFVLAIIFPFVSKKSVKLACAIGLTISLWLSFGSFLDPPAAKDETLVLTTDKCLSDTANSTSTSHVTDAMVQQTQMNVIDESFSVNLLYNFSPILYAALGNTVTVVFGLLFHGITGVIQNIRGKGAIDKSIVNNDEYASTIELVSISSKTRL